MTTRDPTPEDQDAPEEVEVRPPGPSTTPPPIPELLRHPVGIKPSAVPGGVPGEGKGAKGLGPNQDAPLMQKLVKVSTVGTNFAFAVMGMGILGWAVQRWLLPGLAPWPLVAGLGLGLVGGFIRFIRDATALMKD